MIALFAAVFIASLLGSLHCTGMCGAFLAFALTSDEPGAISKARLHAAYNGGRLVTYSVLGAISGAIGSAVDLAGSALGVQRGAAVVAGLMMIVFGLIAVLRVSGVQLPRAPLPPGLKRVVEACHRRAFEMPPIARALVIGLATTLLPCGWLYAFAITAAGTASPLLGALTMAVFWLGTLPVMIGLGVAIQRLTGSLRPRLPLLTSLLIVVVGLWTVAGRMSLPAMARPAQPHAAVPVDDAIKRVQSIHQEELPCCHAK